MIDTKSTPKLTAKQEKFCRNIALKNLTQYEAYIQAGYSNNTMLRNTIDRNASVLMSDTKIAQRINELRDKLIEPEILTVIQRKKRLSDIAVEDITNKFGKPIRSYNIQAIHELNDMEGIGKQEINYNTPGITINMDKVVIEAGTRLEQLLESQSKRLQLPEPSDDTSLDTPEKPQDAREAYPQEQAD
jgi:hypothetical protein